MSNGISEGINKSIKALPTSAEKGSVSLSGGPAGTAPSDCPWGHPSVEDDAQMQKGTGLPVEDEAPTSLAPVVEFHPDHHSTFWPLKKIYQHDRRLGLALSRIDDEIGSSEERVQGYLEKSELREAKRALPPKIYADYKDICSFSSGEGWDPSDIEQLGRRHPRMAVELVQYDRDYSFKKGHSDSFKVSKLPPELQQAFKRVDAKLREESVKKAWDTLDINRGEQLGLWAWGGGMAASMVAGLAMWSAIPIVIGAGVFISPALPFLIGDRFRGGLNRFIGRSARRLFGSRRIKRLVERHPRIAREWKVKALKRFASGKREIPALPHRIDGLEGKQS